MPTYQTFNQHDTTATGWVITVGPKRATFHRRTRWQGSRDGVRLTCAD